MTSTADQLQGRLVESFPRLPTRVVGMREVPAVGLAPALEDATALSPADITRAVRAVIRQR